MNIKLFKCKKIKARKGNSLVEYTLVLCLVGLLMTGLIMLNSSSDKGQANKSTYKAYFNKSFANTADSQGSISIGPLGTLN